MKTFAPIILCLVISCGEAPNAASNETPASTDVDPDQEKQASEDNAKNSNDALFIQAGTEIPACDVESKLIYVQVEKTFKVCAAGAWNNVDLKGDQGGVGAAGEKGDVGNAGSAGATGATGAAGTNGTDNHVVWSMSCSKVISGTLTGLIKYQVDQLASGDLFVYGSAANGQLESSGSQFYSTKQNGSLTGYMSFVFDMAGTYNVGYWSMEINSDGNLKAIYHDSDVAGGALTYVVQSPDCTKMEF